MASRSRFTIAPPLLNSACPWATTREELQALYACPYTGAVTTRTSLLHGFAHNPTTHQHLFFQAGATLDTATTQTESIVADSRNLSSLNTYGYSPVPLSEYLNYIVDIVHGQQPHANDESTSSSPLTTPSTKPFIISVTGSPDELATAYTLIASAADKDRALHLAVELNLSCPNIKGRPPPAYDAAELLRYLRALERSVAASRANTRSVRVGIKLPPYTYRGQFEMVVGALRQVGITDGGDDDFRQSGQTVVDFVTCTNTLGCSLVLNGRGHPALGSESGNGVGGLAGAALHPLALGNVSMFRALLDEFPETRDVLVIGVGGVEDRGGFERMMSVGAGAVGCATALGRYGVDVFERITKG